MPLPWFTAVVHGPSMSPTLRHGDVLVVRRTTRVGAGDVVVGVFRSRPGLLVVKRVVRSAGDGWWLVGDNDFVADDSRSYGVADVVGRVLVRCWPKPTWFKGGVGH